MLLIELKQTAANSNNDGNNNSNGGGYDTLSLWNDELATEFAAAEINKRMRKKKKERKRN